MSPLSTQCIQKGRTTIISSRRTKKISFFVIIIFCAILIIIDRYCWADIAQWREDQATNLWLGYTLNIGHMPVGLISSKDIPNPNGMLLLGSFLSFLPGLLSISFFLSLVQSALLLLVGWKASGGSWQYFMLAALPALSSVILRSTSVEFWNQYLITLVNIFFIFLALSYLEKPSLWIILPIAVLGLLAPSLYLAGIVNAIVMVLITLGMVIYKRPSWAHLWPVATLILVVLLVSVLLTWRPYFQNVSLGQLADFNKDNPRPVATYKTIWESLFGIPIYGTLEWADPAVLALAFKHADPAILTQPSKVLMRLVEQTYLLQAIFALIAGAYSTYHRLVYGMERPGRRSEANVPALRMVVLSLLFICLSFTLSSWIGGPNWLNGERPDQIVQFLPMFLYLIFLLPVLIRIDGRMGRTITGLSYILLAIFVAINLLCGFMIVRDHLQYRGSILSEADIPLVNKEQAVDFIARDWKNYSASKVISVDYDLGGGRWDWVPKFGRRLIKWYPAPMTIGRSFDYELLRKYGLTNSQEGIQLRTFGDGRYLLTYAFEDPPQVKDGQISHFIFGRLRVSVVEK